MRWGSAVTAATDAAWSRLEAAVAALESAAESVEARREAAIAENESRNEPDPELEARAAEVDRLRTLLAEVERHKSAAEYRAADLESRLAHAAARSVVPRDDEPQPMVAEDTQQERIEKLTAELDRLRREHAALRQAAGDAFARVDRAIQRLQAGD